MPNKSILCSNCDWSSKSISVPPSTSGEQIYCEAFQENKLVVSAQACDKYLTKGRNPKFAHAESEPDYVKRKRDSILSISALIISIISLLISLYNALLKTVK